MFVCKRMVAATRALGEKNEDGFGTGLKLEVVLVKNRRARRLYHTHWRGFPSLLLIFSDLTQSALNIPRSLERHTLNRIKLNRYQVNSKYEPLGSSKLNALVEARVYAETRSESM